MKLITTLAVVCLSASALAQGVRYDHRVATIATNYPAGAQVPVMAIPNAQVTLCVDGNCGTKASIFSNQTLTVPTSNPMQADGQGNFGFWAAAGTYFYKVVEPSGKVNGIFPITLGGSGGSTGPVIQVNGTPLITPSPANLVDSASVAFTNPSAGVIQATALSIANDLKMQVVPPVAGQHVIIYPTASSAIQPPPGNGSVIFDNNSAVINFTASVSGGVAQANWSGFTLPAFVNPANVTAIYPVSIVSVPASKIVPNINPPSSQSSCTDGTHSVVVFTNPAFPFPQAPVPLQQFSALLTGAGGSNIPSITCNAFELAASTAFGGSTEVDVSAVALVVYYTGTPPPVDSAISIVPPLNYSTVTNTLGIDIGQPFPGLNLQPKTVATLPPASVYKNTLYLIKDGANSTDCTAGSGTTAVECVSNGTIWTVFASGASGVGSVGTAGQIQMVGSTAGSFAASSVTDNGTTVTSSKPVVVNDGTGKAGAIQLLQGTAPSAAPANTVQINAPTAVTAYAINLPGAQPTAGNTRLDCSAANPAVCSWAAAGGGGSSPLTTKGDLFGHSTVDARIPVGADTFVLTADSTQALGLKWAAPSGGGGTLTPTTIQANGTNCAIAWKNSAGTTTKIELFACAAITDYSNVATTGSLEWAINQLGTNGGQVLLHPGIYPALATILIDWDWITIEGTDLPYWTCCGTPWPTHTTPGTPGGAQIVASGAYATFTIGNTSANMHGDVRHKGIEVSKINGYGAYTATSFIVNLTATQHDDWVRLQDNNINGYTACAIVEQWDTHYIIHNSIQSNAASGICEAGGFYGLISQNIIYDNGGEGVTLSGGVNTIVSNNQFGDLTSAGTLSGGTGQFVDNAMGPTSTTPVTVSGAGWAAQGTGLGASTAPQSLFYYATPPSGGIYNTVAHAFIDNGPAASFMNPITAYAPNVAAGDSVSIGVGSGLNSTNNQAYFGLFYAGSGSTSNYGALSLNGGPQVFTWWPNANVGVGYTSTTGAPPSPLSVTSSNSTPLYVSSSNTCCTQFEMINTSGGHAYNFYTNGSGGGTGYGGVFDLTASSDAYAFDGGSTGQFNLHSGGVFGWTSSATRAISAPDTGLSRCAAGIVCAGTGALASTAGTFKGTGLISAGTKFTTSGCSVSSTTGGATAGIFTLGANSCTVVITMNGATGLAAPNGWSCQAHDRTAPTILIGGESSTTTTTASITIPAGAGATDVISFSCTGY